MDWVFRRPKFYQKLGRNRFHRAQFPSESCAEKLCDRPPLSSAQTNPELTFKLDHLIGADQHVLQIEQLAIASSPLVAAVAQHVALQMHRKRGVRRELLSSSILTDKGNSDSQ